MKTESAFRLSRIQAEGWNAARRLPVTRAAEPNDSEIDALNPYRQGAARLRWNTGFRSALESLRR
jgi:hypothetical protein